jgi:hypothetical protein
VVAGRLVAWIDARLDEPHSLPRDGGAFHAYTVRKVAWATEMALVNGLPTVTLAESDSPDPAADSELLLGGGAARFRTACAAWRTDGVRGVRRGLRGTLPPWRIKSSWYSGSSCWSRSPR